MFDNLIAFWKGKDFLSQVLGDFMNMLDNTERMYRMVCETLLDHKENPGLKEEVYSIDRDVNQLQKAIRRRIVEHLTLQPSADTNVCLCLMSLVKDAERIGDYVKNLYEVIGLLNKPIERDDFSKYFNGLDHEILDLFKKTKEAFAESDDSLAVSSWDDKSKITKKCDGIVEEIAKGSLESNQAVCYVLIGRYFKRVMAHLVNIATSVAVPITDLDYYDEKTD